MPSLQELTIIKNKLEAAKEERMKSEVALANFYTQKEAKYNEIRELGYDPSKLTEEISKLSAAEQELYLRLVSLFPAAAE